MTSNERLAKLAAPSGRVFTNRRRSSLVGEAAACPVKGHGPMLVIRGSAKPWCPNQSHDVERLVRTATR